MATEEETRMRGHMFALFTVLVWGTTFVATKVLLTGFSPVEILFYRFLIGFLVLLAFRPRHVRLGNWRQEAQVAAAGLTGVVLYFLFENIALTTTTASNVGVIVAVSPFFTALLSAVLLKDERPHAMFFAGFALAIAGIALISWSGLGTGSLVGDLLAVAAAAVWSCYAVLTRKLGTLFEDPIQATKRTFAWGLVLMVPALFLFDFHFGVERFLDPLMAGNLLFLGVGASAACFATWGIAVRLLGAVKTSAYIYLVPVITVTASVVVLGEPLTIPIVLGIVLTCAGLVLSERGKGRVKAGLGPDGKAESAPDEAGRTLP
ncbi:MAG: DMT family transporter [Gordonibacter sp.]|uniref:DMT family transporter n=1 Tax=Gordonibacter sp. TaxID=1968902 RepID=UPI002FCBE6E0